MPNVNKWLQFLRVFHRSRTPRRAAHRRNSSPLRNKKTTKSKQKYASSRTVVFRLFRPSDTSSRILFPSYLFLTFRWKSLKLGGPLPGKCRGTAWLAIGDESWTEYFHPEPADFLARPEMLRNDPGEGKSEILEGFFFLRSSDLFHNRFLFFFFVEGEKSVRNTGAGSREILFSFIGRYEINSAIGFFFFFYGEPPGER